MEHKYIIYNDDEREFFSNDPTCRYTRNVSQAKQFDSVDDGYDWLANNVPHCSVTFLQVAVE